MKFQSLKGMEDIVSPDVEKWQILEEQVRIFFEAYGFREIRTPLLESTDLFQRSIGEASDIVHKEMYTFTDRGQRSLTLRPEMTASVVRAVLEHNLIKESEPLFIYYMGPMFRAERPQAGRKRQFHQIGIETLNTHSAVNDAELIIMIKNFLESIGLKRFAVKLNHLGSPEDRSLFAGELSHYFKKIETQLCHDCQYRLSKNVLRIFDCKTSSCQSYIDQAPQLKLSGDSKLNFDKIQKLLSDSQVPYRVEAKLVRGLDYYTGLVFEVTAEGLGSQDAVLAGGRYDSLIQDLGGPKLGASGFSIGTERLLTSLEGAGIDLSRRIANEKVYVAALVGGEESCAFFRSIAQALVQSRKRAHFSFAKGSISSHLSRANKMNAAYIIIVGEDEWKNKEISIKNMATGIQKKLKPEMLPQELSGSTC